MEASFLTSHPFAMFRGRIVRACLGRYTRKIGGAAHVVLYNKGFAPCGRSADIWCSIGYVRKPRICLTCETAVRLASLRRAELADA